MKPRNGLRTYADAVAIVTGAASGIGRALAQALADRRAVVILADRQLGAAEQAAAQIRTAGGRATAVPLDVTDYASVERLVQETITAHGRLDYLFNNAGVGH